MTVPRRYTKPGGWSEWLDWDIGFRCDDDSAPPDSALRRAGELALEACDKIGRTGKPGPYLAQWLTEAGYQNVHHLVYKLPLGTWPKEKKLV